MKTRVTELLGIEYPVIQGGMAWVAEHKRLSPTRVDSESLRAEARPQK
mgnify:CR=1 FL=1